MLVGLQPGQHRADLAFRTNHKRGSVNTHIFLAIHALFFHYAVLVANRFVHVCQKRIRQVVFLFEFLLGRGLVGGNAKDNGTGFLDLFECVAEPARLNRSTGSIGFGIKEQDHILAAIIL